MANTSSPNGAQVNENKVRLIAFFVLLTAITILLTWSVIPAILLVADFALRSFDLGKYSPFAFLAERLVKALKLPFKPIYYPPKRFAARIGLLLSLIIAGLIIAGLSPLIPAAVLALFSALESLVGFCAGCYVFDLLHRTKRLAD
jgi:hypothetical protein